MQAILAEPPDGALDPDDAWFPPLRAEPIRIGELARRTGVSPEVLRAWERRYGLFRPDRTPGGFREYSPKEARRARMMQDRIDGGVPAAEAARRTLSDVPHEAPRRKPGGLLSADPFADLRDAIEDFNGAAAHAAIDRLGQIMSVDSLLTHGVAPYLSEVVDSGQTSDLAEARARFATPLLRGRMLERARGWDVGPVGAVLLACAPGEHHDVGLICTGVALNARGCRIIFLGTDVPVDCIAATAEAVSPDAVVVDVDAERGLVGEHERMRRLGQTSPVYLAGEAVRPDTARAIDARLLPKDPVRAARQVAGDIAESS